MTQEWGELKYIDNSLECDLVNSFLECLDNDLSILMINIWVKEKGILGSGWMETCLG